MSVVEPAPQDKKRSRAENDDARKRRRKDVPAPEEGPADEYQCQLTDVEQLRRLRNFETFLEFRLKYYVEHLQKQLPRDN